MEEFTHTQSLSNYTKFIERNILSDDGSVDFERIGEKTYEATLAISSVDDLRNNLKHVHSFFEIQFSKSRVIPIWYKVNMTDNVGNDIVGIGFLNLQGDWLKFILTYLQEDLADEGGNCLIAVFDIKFKWVINFELFPYQNQLKVESYIKNGG